VALSERGCTLRRRLRLWLLVAAVGALAACAAPGAGPTGDRVRGSVTPDAIVPTATGSTETAPAVATVPVTPPPGPDARRVRAAAVVPASCPVTQPPQPPFAPPAPLAPFAGHFWHGSVALWTQSPADGIWQRLPQSDEGYGQKVLWWREGYDWRAEPQPALTVTGRRLDGPAPPLVAPQATNAFAAEIGSAMLVGVIIPTTGCWELTGRYAGTALSFVIWVAP